MARLLTVNEAADYLRVTPYTIRKWIKRGRIRGSKIGRQYRIRDAEIDAALRGEGELDARPADAEALEREFARLAERWRAETAHHSSMEVMAMHPAYQRIIGMGRAAVPLILRELQREPDEWFWALAAITGENPVRPEDRGKLARMIDSWVRLGRARGWI